MSEHDFTMAEAIAEAQRCLRCKVPQCRRGCPIGNDIPDWIHELSRGNLGNAMAIINAKSNLPAVCGRVCAHERQCEGHCVLGKRGEHIQIGRLERFVSDFDLNMKLERAALVPKTRGRVAVIGSGPAGLTVAGELARQGFAVTILERASQPGGVLMFGIPEYRLPKDVVRREIDKIKELGVTILTNMTVGPDFTVDTLFEQGFDAIFIGTGTAKPNRPDIPGAELGGVYQAVDFLRWMSLHSEGHLVRDDMPVPHDGIVYVIGCGNTAMDAARSVMRLGAHARVVYHRDIDSMSALRSEYDEAVAEGVEFLWNSAITEIRGFVGDVSEVCISHDGEDRVEAADAVILAVGSKPADRIVSSTTGIDVDDRGYVRTREEPYGMSSRRGVFAGGDVASKPATVVHAMQDARRVAEGIARYVDAVKLLGALD